MAIEEKNKKLAFFDGWRLRWQNKGGGELFDEKPNGHCWPVWTPPQKWWDSPTGKAAILSGDFDSRPPNYFKNLNDIQELVMQLNDEDKCRFSGQLMDSMGDRKFELFLTINATAPQRCEAIGKTLNLW